MLPEGKRVGESRGRNVSLENRKTGTRRPPAAHQKANATQLAPAFEKGMANSAAPALKFPATPHIGLAGGGGDKPVVVIDLNEEAHLVGGVAVTHKGAQTRHRIFEKSLAPSYQTTLAKVAPAFLINIGETGFSTHTGSSRKATELTVSRVGYPAITGRPVSSLAKR